MLYDPVNMIKEDIIIIYSLCTPPRRFEEMPRDIDSWCVVPDL